MGLNETTEATGLVDRFEYGVTIEQWTMDSLVSRNIPG
jgi:hypothetical protein